LIYLERNGWCLKAFDEEKGFVQEKFPIAPNDEVSDTTGDAMKNKCRLKKNSHPLFSGWL